MTILELCLSPAAGGLELYAADFTRWLLSAGHAVHVVCRAGSPLDRVLALEGVDGFTFERAGGKVPLGMARRLADHASAHGVDIVHLHWKDDLPLAAFARRLATRRFAVVHSRHMNLPHAKRDPYHRFLYGQVDLYHTVTRALRDQSRARLPIRDDRVQHIFPGVAVSTPSRPEEIAEHRRGLGLDDRFTVGVLGRIERYKGQHLLVEAIAQLRAEGRRVRGVIAGSVMEDEELERLQGIVRAGGLEDDIVFLGFQTAPNIVMQCFDVLALTTVKETFGLVLVEAMQLGVPVIGSAAGGPLEIIDDEKTGLLFETGNATALAAAIRRLHDDDALRQRLVDAAHVQARSLFDRDARHRELVDRMRVAADAR